MPATTLLPVAATFLAMVVVVLVTTVKKPLVASLGLVPRLVVTQITQNVTTGIANKFFSFIKNYWLFFFICFIVLLLLLILIYGGTLQNGWAWNREIISALLGAATVAGITYLLLKGQTSSESTVERNKMVFENRLNAYESFLNTLEGVVVNNRVDETSEKQLQFSIAAIGMHTDSVDMLTISKNLKFIIQRIQIKDRVDGSIWKELMEIVNVLHNSLYTDNVRKLDSNTRKALRNFSSLCVDENYEILEYVECLLSDYKFDSFIASKCLFYSIPVKKNQRIWNHMPKKVYVTLRIDCKNSDDTFNGIVALYCGKGEEGLIDKIIKNPKIWKGPSELTMSTHEDVELGINVIKQACVYEFANKERLALQSMVCDMLNFMYPLWAEKGIAYMRRQKDGTIRREIPWDKQNRMKNEISKAK